MANTGYKNVLTLRKYVDGDPTTITKVNVSTDPDYIAPYEDLTACPFGAEPPADRNLDANGIFEISRFGMRDWFRDNISISNEIKCISGYDPKNNHYVVSVVDDYVEWRENTYECTSGS